MSVHSECLSNTFVLFDETVNHILDILFNDIQEFKSLKHIYFYEEYQKRSQSLIFLKFHILWNI